MANKQQTHLIALGANLPFGDSAPRETLQSALQKLSALGLEVVAVSRFYKTPCFPAGAGPDYVNAAAVLRSKLSAEAVLETLHSVEAAYGREREQRWGMRSLDLDLLAIGDSVLPDKDTFESWQNLPLEVQKSAAPEQLILPHPRLHERAFVLVPLADVAAAWRHPVLGQTIEEMLEALPEDEKQAVKALN